ncbi:hypothetical protein DPMN_013445 [Dreissena polymorpha]|uniref:Uncharacterized protein n=1 Tax=Dreissena polymorpha TaxID=45954 RepID=A0A9D4N7T1_DREPO|nr:hypothetical protein DPMN_013445 [Dreissena polymorpha]
MNYVPQPVDVPITHIHHGRHRKVAHYIFRDSTSNPSKLVCRECGVPEHPPPTNVSHHNGGDTSCSHKLTQLKNTQTDVSGLASGGYIIPPPGKV